MTLYNLTFDRDSWEFYQTESENYFGETGMHIFYRQDRAHWARGCGSMSKRMCWEDEHDEEN